MGRVHKTSTLHLKPVSFSRNPPGLYKERVTEGGDSFKSVCVCVCVGGGGGGSVRSFLCRSAPRDRKHRKPTKPILWNLVLKKSGITKPSLFCWAQLFIYIFFPDNYNEKQGLRYEVPRRTVVENLSRHELMGWIIIANLHSKPMSLFTKLAIARMIKNGY